MKKARSRSGTGDPAVPAVGHGPRTATAETATSRETPARRRRGIRLQHEDPGADGRPPTPGVSPTVDTVELASRRGAEGDDDWDDTSEEPVLVVYGGDERPGSDRQRSDALAASPVSASSGSPVAAPRRGISASHPLAALFSVLGLVAGCTALWLTAAAQAEVGRIQATLAWPGAQARARSVEGTEVARLAELRAAVEHLQGRVAALEEAIDRASASAEPVPTRSPTAWQGGSPVFDGVWPLEWPRLEGPTAFSAATELAAAWSEARWPEVWFRPCVPARDGGCGEGGEVGR